MPNGDTPALWERQAYDTAHTWAFFQVYLALPAPRSVLAAFRQWKRALNGGSREYKKMPGSWVQMVQGRTRLGIPIPGGLSFVQRAEAWDEHVAELERERWFKRREEFREREFAASVKLLEKAEQMLMFPVLEQRTEGGQTIIMPAGWRLRDVPGVLASASRLARLATGLDTEHVRVSGDWRDEAKKSGVDVETVYREVVERLRQEMEAKALGSEGDGEGAGEQAAPV